MTIVSHKTCHFIAYLIIIIYIQHIFYINLMLYIFIDVYKPSRGKGGFIFRTQTFVHTRSNTLFCLIIIICYWYINLRELLQAHFVYLWLYIVNFNAFFLSFSCTYFFFFLFFLFLHTCLLWHLYVFHVTNK